jgi:hypothetical protein
MLDLELGRGSNSHSFFAYIYSVSIRLDTINVKFSNDG